MNHVRVRTAVSPLRRRFPGAATPMPSVDELIAMERPEEPMHCLHRQQSKRPRALSPRCFQAICSTR
jgi:hypothetical protein